LPYQDYNRFITSLTLSIRQVDSFLQILPSGFPVKP